MLLSVKQLLSHKHTRLLGLVYLRTASEELATPREDLPMHRKSELFRLLSAQVPLTLDTLTGILPKLRIPYKHVHVIYEIINDFIIHFVTFNSSFERNYKIAKPFWNSDTTSITYQWTKSCTCTYSTRCRGISNRY